ncbi:Imm42 family immunity protein [Photorhabdus australis]
MIYGFPYEFAVAYEVCELSEYGYWQYGVFNLVIDDLFFYKNKTSRL